jgi:hypothetical protein
MSSIKGATTQEMTSRVPHMTGIGVFMGTVTIGMMNRARHRPVLYRECFCSPPPADDDDTKGACAGATGDLLPSVAWSSPQASRQRGEDIFATLLL